MSIMNNSTTVKFENKMETIYRYSAATSGIMYIICVLFLCFNILSFLSMRRCIRIPYSCKLLTCSMCLCDAVFITIVLAGMFLNGVEVNEIIRSLFKEIGKVCIVVSWLTMTLMSVERMLCLYFPNSYAIYSTKRNMKYVTLATLGVCVFLKLFTRYIVMPVYNQKKMDFVEDTKDLNINTYILGACLFINIICYAAIFHVIRQHVNRMKQVAPIHWINATSSYSSTKSVCSIFFVFFAFHFPLFIALIFRHSQNEATNARFLSFTFTLIMCGIHPVLYAWRFKECRYYTLLFFSKKMRICEPQLNRMKVDVYHIVTYPRASGDSMDNLFDVNN